MNLTKQFNLHATLFSSFLHMQQMKYEPQVVRTEGSLDMVSVSYWYSFFEVVQCSNQLNSFNPEFAI